MLKRCQTRWGKKKHKNANQFDKKSNFFKKMNIIKEGV